MLHRALCGGLLAGLLLMVGCATPMNGLRTEGCVQTVPMKMDYPPSGSESLGFGNCQWLYPFDAPQEPLVSQPKYASDKRVFYAAKYGDSKDNVFTMVLDESQGTGAGFDTFYVDVNNDNRLDAQGERFPMEPSGLTSDSEKPARITLQVCSGGKTFPYTFGLTAFPYSDDKNSEKKMHANARNSSFCAGEAVIAERTCKIALADLDSNGVFNNPEKGGIFEGDRWFVDVNGDGKFTDEYPLCTESFPYGGYTRIEGAWYCLTASPDGGTIHLAHARPPLGWVECAAPSSTVNLNSETQSLQLRFDTARQEAVAGTYRTMDVFLKQDDVSLYGQFPKDAPQVVVTEGGVTVLAAGPPLDVSVSVSRLDDAGCVGVDLVITGQGGETYRGGREASFEVQDEKGHVVATAKFEYG